MWTLAESYYKKPSLFMKSRVIAKPAGRLRLRLVLLARALCSIGSTRSCPDGGVWRHNQVQLPGKASLIVFGMNCGQANSPTYLEFGRDLSLPYVRTQKTNSLCAIEWAKKKDALTVIRTPGKNISRLPNLAIFLPAYCSYVRRHIVNPRSNQANLDRCNDANKLTPMAYKVDHVPNTLHDIRA